MNVNIAPQMMWNIREQIRGARTIDIGTLSKLVQPRLGLGVSIDLRPFLAKLEERGDIVHWVDGPYSYDYYHWLVEDDREQLEKEGKPALIERLKQERRDEMVRRAQLAKERETRE